MKENNVSIHWYPCIVTERPGLTSLKHAMFILNVGTVCTDFLLILIFIFLQYH